MNSPDQTNRQDPSESPFGKVFDAYSEAFRSRDHDGLKKAFHPDAKVRVHDRHWMRGDEQTTNPRVPVSM